ncbi:MAG: LysM peptidoglycan-binding domain-containing protein [Lachnospiraceae bacterium]|nr:LysM peptidoglycan-binding domain-containing protein [Lachnospiraceae bacterium]
MKKCYATNAIRRRRRQLQVRRNICMLVLSVMAVVLLSVFVISISTQASDLKHTAKYKYYKSIEVSKGDTLWSIAKENMDTDHYKNVQEYVNEIKTMNSIKSDHIMSGSSLIIPYYSSGLVQEAH